MQSTQSADLLHYAYNDFSQFGEDGILAKILELLPERDLWCVEFGAWDGIHLSNTRSLIEKSAYKAVLIEADSIRYNQLVRNNVSFPNVICLKKWIGFSEHNNLDAALSTTSIPKNFDLLSIDIDGNDYHIWDSVQNYSPKIVIIEFNPTIPTEAEFVQERKESVMHGASLMSLVMLGRIKSYELVCVTQNNAIFVLKKYFPLFSIRDNSPFVLRKDTAAVTYLFSSYDGTVLMTGFQRLPWHNLKMSLKKVQHLPVYLRKYIDNYNPFEKFCFKVFKFLNLLFSGDFKGLLNALIKHK